MANEKRAEWTDRDELASMFMQAIITGKAMSGAQADVDARPRALKAYQIADAFLAVRNAGGK